MLAVALSIGSRAAAQAAPPGSGGVQGGAQLGAQVDVSGSAATPAPPPSEPPAPAPAAAAPAPPAAPAAAAPAAAAPVAAPAAAPAPEQPPEPAAWDLTHRAYNTLEGSTGGLYLIDPGMAVEGAVRVQFALDSYSGDSFLYDGDEVEQDRQHITATWTALDLLEVLAAIENRSTVSDIPVPNTLHALGDLTIGAKLRGEPSPMWRLGGGLRFTLLNDIGEQETLLDATSIGLTGAVALDLQRQTRPIPLIFRFNVDYLFDNSAEVLDNIEDVRYDALEDADPPRDRRSNEVRNLITRVERFGLGVSRVDMLTLALGLEVPLQLGERFFLHPLLDYRLGIPINRQGYDCAFFSTDSDRGTNTPIADDTCLDDAGFDAYPMNLAIGARFVPPVRGLSALLGVDFGLNGTDAFVRELSPVAPFRVLFTLGYDYDARPPPPPPAPPPPPPPPPLAGRLRGRISDQNTGVPIAGVVVRFADRDLPPVASDASGRFTSYELEPGAVDLDLSHPDYESRRCGTAIPSSGGDVEVSCTLTGLPTTGGVQGTVNDAYGATVAGVRVQIVGPSTQTVATGPAGDFTANQLAPGDYTARIESESHLMRVAHFSVQARQTTRVEVALLPRPSKSSVERRGNELKVKGLAFAPGSAELAPGAAQAVAEVADLMLREPSMRRLRIQGDGGESLSFSRALAIKQRLVDTGVPDARLEAVTEPGNKLSLTFAE